MLYIGTNSFNIATYSCLKSFGFSEAHHHIITLGKIHQMSVQCCRSNSCIWAIPLRRLLVLVYKAGLNKE